MELPGILILGVTALATLTFLVGALRGHLHLRPCCPPAEHDLRMREVAKATEEN